MDKISTILIPFDFSESAKRALEYAVAFIGRNGDIKIILAYISGHSNFELLPENFTKLEEKYRPMLKNKLEWKIQGGSLTQSLLDIQKTRQIDLVIMGTLGSRMDGNSDETNTSKLVLAADCPVLVVPKGNIDFRMRCIALVLGKEEIDDTEALGILLKFARRFNAKVHVVTVKNRPGSYGYSEEEEKNENTVEYYLENFYAERVFINNKDVAKGILTYVSKNDIDLIAILPRNHAMHGEPSEGQLTRFLAVHSQVPVLAID